MPSEYKVLFLCTGNSARSILADAILNHRGSPIFHGFSAGSQPTGQVNPHALEQLEATGLPTAGLRSKSWEEFAKPGSEKMNFVFTVCDNAAKEICPIWPGQPVTAHWGVADPVTVVGSPDQVTRAFRETFVTLERRIALFLSLLLSSLSQLAIKQEVDRIGREV